MCFIDTNWASIMAVSSLVLASVARASPSWVILDVRRYMRRLSGGPHLLKTNLKVTYMLKSTSISKADARRWGFSVMSSIDNPKASKATAYGYLNAILYMAHADSAGGTLN